MPRQQLLHYLILIYLPTGKINGVEGKQGYALFRGFSIRLMLVICATT
jgi:hypothetical protein